MRFCVSSRRAGGQRQPAVRLRGLASRRRRWRAEAGGGGAEQARGAAAAAPRQLRPSRAACRRSAPPPLTMELSEAASCGLRILADPGLLDQRAFAIVLAAALRGLAGGGTVDGAEALDLPELQHIDPMTLKHCHAATTACLLEAGKQNADTSTLSTCLEECHFDRGRIDHFCKEYEKNKAMLDVLLGSLGRCPLHITDASWRLQYQLKNSQVHKNHRPEYLVNLNVESPDSRAHPDISFNCSMEQLQDLVGKLKDAAKSLERASQL